MSSSVLKFTPPIALVIALAILGFGAARYAIGQVEPEEKLPTPTAVSAGSPESSVTAPATALPSPEPTATPETPSPSPTAETNEPVTPPPLGCDGCRVGASKQMRVETRDIQLGGDGKYLIPDRGDGCAYQEVYRTSSLSQKSLGLEEVILRAPDCEVTWAFVPATGELAALRESTIRAMTASGPSLPRVGRMSRPSIAPPASMTTERILVAPRSIPASGGGLPLAAVTSRL